MIRTSLKKIYIGTIAERNSNRMKQSRSTSPQLRGSSRERKYDNMKRRDVRGSKDDKPNNNDSRSRSRSKSPQNSSANDKIDTLFISNLSKRVEDDRLKEKFSKYGQILDLKIVRDPFTRDCRGFGFMKFSSAAEATEARAALDNTDFNGRMLKVEKAKRSKGHESTPGKYLGHNRSNNGRRPSSPYSRGGRSDMYPKKRDRSRSRSRSRDRDRNRSESWSRKGGRRDRSRDQSREKDRHRSRSRDRSREKRR